MKGMAMDITHPLRPAERRAAPEPAGIPCGTGPAYPSHEGLS